MSQKLCHAVFNSPQLSDAAFRGLAALDSSSWSQLWSLILQYGAPVVVKVVEAVVPALPIGATGKVILGIIVAELEKLVPTP